MQIWICLPGPRPSWLVFCLRLDEGHSKAGPTHFFGTLLERHAACRNGPLQGWTQMEDSRCLEAHREEDAFVLPDFSGLGPIKICICAQGTVGVPHLERTKSCQKHLPSASAELHFPCAAFLRPPWSVSGQRPASRLHLKKKKQTNKPVKQRHTQTPPNQVLRATINKRLCIYAHGEPSFSI